jgi:hypothetical protein
MFIPHYYVQEALGSERNVIAEKTTTPCEGHPTLGGSKNI